MTTKKELLQKCKETLENTRIFKWYDKNLTGDNQGNTIQSLMLGIEHKEITVEEALYIALLVGVQWNVKFEGVP